MMQKAPRAMSTLMRSCMTLWSWSPRRVTAAFWSRWWCQGNGRWCQGLGYRTSGPGLLFWSCEFGQVGFLKILHRYEITFTLPPVHRLSKDIREAPVPSLHLKLLSIMPVPEGYSVKCEYSAHKEGVLKEEMLLACEGGAGTCVRVTVQARVMDRHHGTPMLLDGVKCVGAELEYDSEHSDWHGFD
ncbi:adipose-secreted signaling protein isoform X3 [Canis lupus baileyi]|uniref:Adipose-secreted signaling protein n=1 Tax=Canis lupus familiaris TaxID=9615 RepID=A0A8P0T2J2_CANLF